MGLTHQKSTTSKTKSSKKKPEDNNSVKKFRSTSSKSRQPLVATWEDDSEEWEKD